MNDISALDLLQTRRTVTAAYLSEPGPGPDEIDQLVTIAMRVPDHGKLAPWRFVSLPKDIRQTLAPQLVAIGKAAHSEEQAAKVEKEIDIFQVSPACLLVVSTTSDHPKIPHWEQDLSAGASTMNLMLGAHALGYSAQWLTGWLTYNDDAKALLGVKPQEKIAALVHIGTPTIPPVERPRPSLEGRLSVLASEATS